MLLLLRRLLNLKRMITRSLLLLSLIFLNSCGLSTGLYDDILKAQDYIKEQKFEKAVKIYESILLKKPSKTVKIKINFQLGEIYSIYLNDFKKSEKYFNEIVNESNEPIQQVQALEKLGNIYFNNIKDYKSSEKAYNQLRNFYPPLQRHSFYNYQHALSIFKQKKYKKAILTFTKLMDHGEDEYSVKAHYYIGLSHFYKKDYELALESWFEYLKREKRSDLIVQTKFLIANAYESSEKLKEAYNIYYSLLGEYPNADVIKNRLNALYERRVARKR